MVIKDKVINFLGDSITQGIGASDVEHGYVSVLSRIYGLRRANNYGISGTRIAKRSVLRTNEKEDQHFSTRVEVMDPDADIIIVFGGTNDYGHGDALLGTPDDRTEDTFYGACHYLFRSLSEKYGDRTIVVLTPLHRSDENEIKYKGKEEQPTILADYVRIVRDVAQYYSFPICDLWESAEICPTIAHNREALCPDGCHPNDEGHALLAHILGRFLVNL
jgi:lysophospholipase L1-like esterase